MYVGRCHAQVPSDHADNLQLALQCIPIKGFHHIFVGASLDRCLDMTKSVFRGAEDDLGPCVHFALAQCLQKFRSEEHTSELQSLMRISYAVFCFKKKIQQKI